MSKYPTGYCILVRLFDSVSQLHTSQLYPGKARANPG